VSKGWSNDRRAKQRAAIYRWRPWDKSTGPKSPEGKSATARSSLKHGATTRAAKAERRTLARLLATGFPMEAEA
jgi:hypothetical protein